MLDNDVAQTTTIHQPGGGLTKRAAPRRYAVVSPLAALVVLAAMSPLRAQANYQTCADKFVSLEIVRCPDGSVPHYTLGDPPAAAGMAGMARPPAKSGNPDISELFGVWHTNRPGESYMNALDVPGSYLLAAKPGLGQGDLTISPNGTFVWNSFSGTSGRWVRGEKAGLVLYDESTRTKWRLNAVGESISISADTQTFTGRR